MLGAALGAFCLVYLPLTQLAVAATLSLAWDAVTAPELAGYKVHYGYGSGSYSLSVDVGKSTTAALSGLTEARVYYLAVTAYGTSGTQSDYSNEVIYDLTSIDTDRDGLNDWDELSVYKTNPDKADTDGDGVADAAEVKGGSNPLDRSSVPAPAPAPAPAPTPAPTPAPAPSENLEEIPQAQMHVVSVDSEELTGENGAAANVLDGQPETMWHTQWWESSPTHPHQIVIGLGGTYEVKGLRYLPRQDGNLNGTVAQYSIYVSTDNVNWGSAVATGTFATDATEKEVVFAASKVGQYVRFVAQSEVNGNPWTSAAELYVLATW